MPYINDGKGKPLKRFEYLNGQEPIENRFDISGKEKKCRELGHIQTTIILNFARTYREIKCDICCYSYYVDSSD